MLTYVDTLFSNRLIIPYRDRIVLGKPFGSQAYYLVWKKLGYIDNIDELSVGVKHDEIDFVDYGEETMGNALGVATGIALANPNQNVWVNITDATLQMGSTLEALQYIGHNQIKNIIVTVDYNNMQVTGATDDILCVHPVLQLCKYSGWDVKDVNGHSMIDINETWNTAPSAPCIYFYRTVKGYGVDYMIDNPVMWHYRPVEQL
jgi:transketolase